MKIGNLRAVPDEDSKGDWLVYDDDRFIKRVAAGNAPEAIIGALSMVSVKRLTPETLAALKALGA